MRFTQHPHRRGFTLAALAVLLGIAMLSLTQCRLVTDAVTGVDVKSASSLHGKSTCVQSCNEKYKACKRAEDAVHKQKDGECRKGQSAERKLCQKTEQRRHQDEQKACVREKNGCKNGCYNEGGGGDH